jgi:hypothetical protein
MSVAAAFHESRHVRVPSAARSATTGPSKPLASLTAASALLAGAPAALNSVQAVAARIMFRALIWIS